MSRLSSNKLIIFVSFIFILAGAAFLFTPKSASATNIWCDHRESNGSCRFWDWVNQPDQAYLGSWSLASQGYAGWFGPGNARVDACLNENGDMWYGACWTLYDWNLGDNLGYSSGSRDIGANPYPAFHDWVINVYGNESITWGSTGIGGRHVSNDYFDSSSYNVNAGDQFTVYWGASNVMNSTPQISWEGAVVGGDNYQPVGSSDDKTFTAGPGGGTVWLSFENMCGPSWWGFDCPGKRDIFVNVNPPPKGNISVNTNIPSSWSVCGPACYNGSGWSSYNSGADPGWYNIYNVPGAVGYNGLTYVLSSINANWQYLNGNSTITYDIRYSEATGAISVSSNIPTSWSTCGSNGCYNGSGWSSYYGGVHIGWYSTYNVPNTVGYNGRTYVLSSVTGSQYVDTGQTRYWTITYVEATGNISVSTNIPTSWNVCGPACYGGSGWSSYNSGVPAGWYSLSSVPNQVWYNSRLYQLSSYTGSQFVGNYATTYFSINYYEATGAVSVSSNIPSSWNICGPFSCYGGSGTSSYNGGVSVGWYGVSSVPSQVWSGGRLYQLQSNTGSQYVDAGSTRYYSITYYELTGAISVSSNIPSSWTTCGPFSCYGGSGTSSYNGNVSVGNYSVSSTPNQITYGGNIYQFQSVTGTQYVNAGTTRSFTITYALVSGNITVSASNVPTSWRICGPAACYSHSGWSSNDSPVIQGTYSIDQIPTSVSYNGYLWGLSTPSNGATQSLSAGQTKSWTITYYQVRGTLNVNSNLSSSWTISGGVGSRSGTSSSDSLLPASYTVTPAAQAGYTYVPNPSTTVTIAGNVTTTVNIVYTIIPLNAPTLITPLNNSVCKHVTMNWVDNSNNESNFRVYRNGSLVASLAANTTTYQDTPPGLDTNYTYYIAAWNNVPYSRESVSSSSSIMNLDCVANMANSTKIMTAPPINNIHDGDTMVFLITISNGGNTPADIRYITDTWSSNLTNMRVTAVSGVSCNPNLPQCISGNTINVTGQIAPGTNATVNLRGTLVLANSETYETVSNSANIFYYSVNGDGILKNIARTAGPYLVRTGLPSVPGWREVAP